MKKTLSLSLSKMSFESSEDRTNWMTFKGVCAFVDRPSDHIPSGGIDKPTLFPREETMTALPTFVDMGVNCRYSSWDTYDLFEGHNSQFKVGVVKTADIIGDEVVITGGLWSYDFWDLCDKVKSAKESLGWSIEVLMILTDKGDYYEATEIEFLGVALMWADKTAFKQTCMLARNKENKGGIPMEKQELQDLLAVFATNIAKNANDAMEALKLEFTAKVDEVSKGVYEGFAKIEAEKAELALAAEAAKAEAEEKARLALEAKEALEAEAAEKARLALEAEESAKVQRQTLMFGSHVKKFEGNDEAEKAIIADATLSPGEQFRKIIELKLAAAK